MLRAEEVAAASAEARDEYVAMFRARFDLSPAGEWLTRWWPLAGLAPRIVTAVPPPVPRATLDDAAP